LATSCRNSWSKAASPPPLEAKRRPENCNTEASTQPCRAWSAKSHHCDDPVQRCCLCMQFKAAQVKCAGTHHAMTTCTHHSCHRLHCYQRVSAWLWVHS
jgi:hypothetical protein